MGDLRRVYRLPDGSVRIYRPNPKRRLEGESDADFLERMASAEMVHDPSKQGLPFVDVDASALPTSHEGNCPACGDRHSLREQWRVKAGKVVVDPAAPSIVADHVHATRDLDRELAKANPDPVKVLQLQRARELAAEAIRQRAEGA